MDLSGPQCRHLLNENRTPWVRVPAVLAAAARTLTLRAWAHAERGEGWLGGLAGFTRRTNWWASTLILGLSSKKLQSCLQILGQSSVTSAPPPGSPPGWVGRPTLSPYREVPAPPCQCHPLVSDKAGTSRGSSRASSVAFMKLELPGACAGLVCFECYLHCNRQA